MRANDKDVPMTVKEFKADYERETGEPMSQIVAEILHDRYMDAWQHREIVTEEDARWMAEQDAIDRAEEADRAEYYANYQECEHGLDASLCGGPMHWHDETNGPDAY